MAVTTVLNNANEEIDLAAIEIGSPIFFNVPVQG